MTRDPPPMLPGSGALTLSGDLATEMVNGIHRFLDRMLAESRAQRDALWRPAPTAVEPYLEYLNPHRSALRRIIGAVDSRSPPALDVLAAAQPGPVEIGRSRSFKVYAVRWAALDGVDAEGLMLVPEGQPRARVVALPDADNSPEQLAGLAPGLPPSGQLARRLAENACQVLVPTLIDRSDEWSGNPDIAMTSQPHREFIYRMAYQVGRHVIGYEVQKVLAAVDWFEKENSRAALPTGVAGYGEGALLALLSGALDERITAVLVSGHFGPREDVWREPIYRNLWGLLQKFGDAELAAMIAPRGLVIEACRGPEVAGPPPARDERRRGAPGRITTRTPDEVRREFNLAQRRYAALNARDRLRLIVAMDEEPGSEAALVDFLGLLSGTAAIRPPGKAPRVRAGGVNPEIRRERQFRQLVEFTQTLARRSEVARRANYWRRRSQKSVDRWQDSYAELRDRLWEDIIGKLSPPTLAPSPRTRLAYRTQNWSGYEVVLDLWPDVFAYGILLVPNDLEPGERRPVVVCQHGLEGRAQEVVDPAIESVYHGFGGQLAERGFVVFAPQQPHIGEDNFRMVQRKANPLGLTLWAFVLRQHERILDWLATLPFVDAGRIAFYGLSYGGFTAMRVPAILGRYCLAICSANFNDWVWKTTTLDYDGSYMFTREFEIPEFDIASTFNYAELTGLIAPRPFMVERGHDDGVAPDERVAFEYAKARRLYVKLGIPERIEIEYFNGGHEINGQGTFEFLRKHLSWPRQGPANPDSEPAPRRSN